MFWPVITWQPLKTAVALDVCRSLSKLDSFACVANGAGSGFVAVG